MSNLVESSTLVTVNRGCGFHSLSKLSILSINPWPILVDVNPDSSDNVHSLPARPLSCLSSGPILYVFIKAIAASSIDT